jgi:sulfatase-modifying factor enzyme 1
MAKKTAKKTVIAAMIGLVTVSVFGGIYLAVRVATNGGGLFGAIGGRTPYQKKHDWRSVRGKHWQIISTEFEDPSVTDSREGTRGPCSAGMVHVKGNMKLEPETNPYSEGRLETMQLKICTEWISKEYPERCQSFDAEKWHEMTADLPTKPMEYCIDRFEYPNIKGQYPLIFVNWYEAKDLCEEQGKRLCDEDEWTFACEGEEAHPYPYGNGFVRDPSQCITDSHWIAYNEKPMATPDTDEAGLEMDRLWQGFAAGEQKQCKSKLGVYDMTGNVDEWTTSTRPGERPSILKGGYWGPVRTRCRPSTRSHDQNHKFYQQGFRCCSDVGAHVHNADSGEAAAPIRRELE